MPGESPGSRSTPQPHPRAVPLRQHLRPPAGALLRARFGHQGCRATPREGQSPAGRAARASTRSGSPRPEGAQVLAGNVVPRRRGADRARVRRAISSAVFVPQLGDGRAILLGEVVGRRRPAARRAAQRRRANAVLARRRRARRARPGAARIRRERGDGGARHPDDARARGRDDRRAGRARRGAARRRPRRASRRATSASGRSSFSPRATTRGAARARGLRARAPLSRRRRHAATTRSRSSSGVIDAQAALVARWLGVGFVHGVMNTDNTSISGETIDYGPCAFLDEYDPSKTFSSIDHGGRYAFAEPAAHRALEPRAPRRGAPAAPRRRREGSRPARDRAPRALRARASRRRTPRCCARSSGSSREEERRPRRSLEDLLAALAANRVDYTLFFRRALPSRRRSSNADADVAALFADTRTRSRDGRRHGAAGCARERRARARARRRCGARTPRSFRATTASKRRSTQRPHARRLPPLRDARSTCSLVPTTTSPSTPSSPTAPPAREEQREYKTFCGT